MSLDLHYVCDTEKDNRRREDVNVVGIDFKFRIYIHSTLEAAHWGLWAGKIDPYLLQ